MREYETTFIIQPEISEEGIQAICGRLEGILEKHGATKLFYDDMGRRRLAYEIKKFQKGQYLTLFFLDEGQAVSEIERVLRLDDSILRFLTVLGNPEVTEIEARKAEAVELERVRAERAVEKAARETEEAAARDAEEAERAAANAERAAAEAARAAEEGERTDAAPASEEGALEAVPAEGTDGEKDVSEQPDDGDDARQKEE